MFLSRSIGKRNLKQPKTWNHFANCLLFIFSDIFVIFLAIVSIVNTHYVYNSKSRYKDLFLFYFQCDRFDEIPSKQSEIQIKCKSFELNDIKSPLLFVIYDVNPMEGFNLRRDVYIRLAVFIKSLRQRPHFRNVHFVLPPFHRLYHWNIGSDDDNSNNDIVFWNHFFDLESMKRYTDVLDIWQYFDILENCFGFRNESMMHIDRVFKLQHFRSMFQSGKFEEKFKEYTANCDVDLQRNRGQFIDLYKNFSVDAVHCVEFQGTASLLHDLLRKYSRMYETEYRIAISSSYIYVFVINIIFFLLI